MVAGSFLPNKSMSIVRVCIIYSLFKFKKKAAAAKKPVFPIKQATIWNLIGIKIEKLSNLSLDKYVIST